MRFYKAKELITKYNNEWKNQHIHKHCLRVMKYVSDICEEMKIPEDYRLRIELAAKYHDIGKIMYKEWMLSKDPFKGRKPTKREIKKFQKHVKHGYKILKTFYKEESIATFVLLHHEKMDGTGFPYRLKADEIPLGSRIITVCDAFDAMYTHYNLRTKSETIKELKRQSGLLLDEEIVKIFLKILANHEKD